MNLRTWLIKQLAGQRSVMINMQAQGNIAISKEGLISHNANWIPTNLLSMREEMDKRKAAKANENASPDAS